MPDDWIIVGITGHIGATAVVSLTNSAGSMDEGLVESAIVRLIGVFVTQMPLSKDSGGVSRLLQHLGQSHCIQSEPFTFEDCVRDTVTQRVSSGHQG